jgi:hypothetical protein
LRKAAAEALGEIGDARAVTNNHTIRLAPSIMKFNIKVGHRNGGGFPRQNGRFSLCFRLSGPEVHRLKNIVTVPAGPTVSISSVEPVQR